MENSLKLLLIVLTILYVISPVDFVSGSPIDDIIIVLMSLAAQRKLGTEK